MSVDWAEKSHTSTKRNHAAEHVATSAGAISWTKNILERNQSRNMSGENTE